VYKRQTIDRASLSNLRGLEAQVHYTAESCIRDTRNIANAFESVAGSVSSLSREVESSASNINASLSQVQTAADSSSNDTEEIVNDLWAVADILIGIGTIAAAGSITGGLGAGVAGASVFRSFYSGGSRLQERYIEPSFHGPIQTPSSIIWADLEELNDEFMQLWHDINSYGSVELNDEVIQRLHEMTEGFDDEADNLRMKIAEYNYNLLELQENFYLPEDIGNELYESLHEMGISTAYGLEIALSDAISVLRDNRNTLRSYIRGINRVIEDYNSDVISDIPDQVRDR